jgi:hypothetical protein
LLGQQVRNARSVARVVGEQQAQRYPQRVARHVEWAHSATRTNHGSAAVRGSVAARTAVHPALLTASHDARAP